MRQFSHSETKTPPWSHLGHFCTRCAPILQSTSRLIVSLGPNETESMGCLWAPGPLTVKQIHKKIQAYRMIAYTSMLTMSARLAEKG